MFPFERCQWSWRAVTFCSSAVSACSSSMRRRRCASSWMPASSATSACTGANSDRSADPCAVRLTVTTRSSSVLRSFWTRPVCSRRRTRGRGCQSRAASPRRGADRLVAVVPEHGEHEVLGVGQIPRCEQGAVRLRGRTCGGVQGEAQHFVGHAHGINCAQPSCVQAECGWALGASYQ